ncbi:putative methyltransferase (TIGR04325 family) [Lysobacter niastensis]|uniref:Methyltransferase (TIGR04325 family) n=1 Tax=Lysobacter niastensis TaxID=380629 RepID=A0ABU1W992_9GAMM|nr:TIGR04325 family methyltransferase [Lysobacter niastensis]MDR7134165.1 putative methyltransferase (TIGR04325 family) [Lysobacter niastensis]
MTIGIARHVRSKLKLIACEAAELPIVRLVAEPLYRRAFQRPFQEGNAYYGVFDSYDQARAEVPTSLSPTYDVAGAGNMYTDRIDRIRVSDYPMVYWLSRLVQAGQRRIFDLGGHIGISYYGFRRHVQYPEDLRWLVHDVPAVTAAGRERARELDPEQRLSFTDSREAADGHDVLVCSGALQYLDYTLSELLGRLTTPPQHILVNLTPMHPTRSYFTIQNMGVAACPYRVMAVPEFVGAVESLGYTVVDRWESLERDLRIPFFASYSIDRYYGFYFRLDHAGSSTRMNEPVDTSCKKVNRAA